jgi:hypothetical protein
MTSYVPPMPIWHCPSCAIEWTSRPNETCWACGGPAECGPWRSENGVTCPTTSPMHYTASQETGEPR